MSAPCSSGRIRYGVEIVASTTRGTPASWATAASPSRSAISPEGVGDNLRVDCLGVLGQRRLVIRRVGAFHESGFDAESAQGDIQLVTVPPYSWEDATIWSPAWQSAAKVMNSAAMPDAVATAPIPPSRDAMRSSSAATVGFDRRE